MAENNALYSIYFLSQYGNDENSGLDEQSPKRTLASVNKLSNCTILLKSGEEFALTSTKMNYFTPGSNCTIASYGGNTRPIINGYISFTQKWVKQKENVYKASFKDIGFFDIQKYHLSNLGHLLVNNMYNGMQVATMDGLKNEGEYYIDDANIEFYYYTKSNIEQMDFKISRNTHGIAFINVDNSAVYNLEIKGFGRHGIWVKDSKNIKIKNNYVHQIGGCKLNEGSARYGNGIEVWDGGENVEIAHNHVTDCYDAGITNQTSNAIVQKNIYIKSNLIQRCWYSTESFDGTATKRASFSNIVYEDNILMDASDITKGHRLNSNNNACSHFRMQIMSGNELVLRNNICYLAQLYMINSNTTGLAGVKFDGNIYIQKAGGMLYYPFYHRIGESEKQLSIKLAPTKVEEYASYSYAMSLITQKLIDQY